jgi:putative salt-induced outer membrane protein YdiY
MKKIVLSSLALASLAMADVALSDVEAKYSNTAKVEAAKDFKQHIDLGFANTTGNTDTLNFNLAYNFTYTTVGINDQDLNIAFDTSMYISENDNVRDNNTYQTRI